MTSSFLLLYFQCIWTTEERCQGFVRKQELSQRAHQGSEPRNKKGAQEMNESELELRNKQEAGPMSKSTLHLWNKNNWSKARSQDLKQTPAGMHHSQEDLAGISQS